MRKQDNEKNRKEKVPALMISATKFHWCVGTHSILLCWAWILLLFELVLLSIEAAIIWLYRPMTLRSTTTYLTQCRYPKPHIF